MTAKLEIVMVDATQGADAPASSPGAPNQPPGAPVAPPVHQQPRPRQEKPDPSQQPTTPKQPANKGGLGSVFEAVGKSVEKAIPEVEAIRSVLGVVKNLRRILEDAGKAPQSQGRPGAGEPRQSTSQPQRQVSDEPRPAQPTQQQRQANDTPRPAQTPQPQRKVSDEPRREPQPIQREDFKLPDSYKPKNDKPPTPESRHWTARPASTPRPSVATPPVRPTRVSPPRVTPPSPAAGAATAGARGAASAGAAGAGGGGAATGGAVAAVANPVGLTVAAVVVAIAGLGIAAKKLSDKFSEVAKGVEDFSPALLSVQAGREARMIELQQERANKLGNGLAGVESARASLDESIYRLQTQIYELLLRKFGPVLEAMIDSLTVGVEFVNTVKERLDVISAAVSMIVNMDFQGGMANLNQQMKEANEADKKLLQAIQNVFVNNGGNIQGDDPDVQALLSLGMNGAMAPGNANTPPINNPFNP